MEGYPWDEWVCWRAAEGGQLDTLKWLHAQSAPWDSGTINVAAKHGRLDIIEWAREQHPPCPWEGGGAYREAALSGHLHILKWLFAHGCPDLNDDEDSFIFKAEGDSSLNDDNKVSPKPEQDKSKKTHENKQIKNVGIK